MARTKEFDPGVALDAALQLFWARGYAATSMADLVDALGVSRSSLYATFGDKHALYLQALDRYLTSRDPDPIEVLSQPGPALPAVRDLVTRYAEETISDPYRGCFLVNTATELAAGDPEAAARVERSWARLETALCMALTRARAQGELAKDADPAGLARFLLVVLQGLKVVGQGSPDPERIRAAARHALSMLA